MRSRYHRYLFFFIGFFAILVTGVYLTVLRKIETEQDIRQEIFHTVDVAIAATDPKRIDALPVTPQDVNDPNYLRLREVYLKLQPPLQEKNIRWVYAMKIFGDEVRFVLDSAAIDDPGHSEPGVVYQEPPSAIFEVAHTGKTVFTGPYTDEYGSYYSVFSPIRDFYDDHIVGIMGADIEVARYQALLQEKLRTPFLLTILTEALFILLCLYNENRLITKRAEAERREEREALLYNIGEGVVACDTGGNVIFINRFASQLLGDGSSNSGLGESFREHWMVTDEQGAVLPDSAQPFILAMREKKSLATSSHPFYLRRKGGSLIPVAISMSAVHEDSSIKFVIMAFRDISRETEIDHMKSEFISIAAHQLKSPMTILNWATETLKKNSRGKPFAKLHRDIDEIQKTVTQMNDLINSLLNVSRIESGRVSIDPQPTNICELAKQATEEMSVLAKKKKQHLEIDCTKRIRKINTDPRMISEALKNLVSNAIKYTPDGGHIRIRVAISNGEIMTSVSDDGYGIPSQEQKRVFQKFFRGSNVSSLIDGTGLGLFLVQKIIEESGGRIGFKSVEGKGTTFWFTLPLSGSKRKKGEVTIS